MTRKAWQFSGLAVVACLLLIYILLPSVPDLPSVKPKSSSVAPLPDFTQYDQVTEKKQAFFDYILEFVQQENNRIAVQREQLLLLSNRPHDLNRYELEWLQSMAKYYRVKLDAEKLAGDEVESVIARLLLKVDKVPASLALAQSANESAWGTSRFALKGNNLFGQWCFSKGCGLVPNSRDSGAKHEVAKFANPKKSVEAYIRNINSHRAYRKLRSKRAQLRDNDKKITGYSLAEGLDNYSERGEAYIEELRSMMRVNNLGEYDVEPALEVVEK